MVRFPEVIELILNFYSESFYHIVVYAIYALFVCAVMLLVEYKIHSDKPVLKKLCAGNFIMAMLSVIFVAISMFVVGWAPWIWGGQSAKLVATLFIMAVSLYYIKLSLIKIQNIPYVYPGLACGVSTLVLLAPYIAFNIFLLLLATADWRY